MLSSGRKPALEFIEEQRPEVQAPFLVLFQHMANYGAVQAKRFKKEMGKLYAFRHEIGKRQIRFPCFLDGNRWIITHGFVKPGSKGMGKWPPDQVNRAERIQAEYWERKRAIEATRGKQ